MNTFSPSAADSNDNHPADVMSCAIADALVILRTVFCAADDGAGLYFTTDMHGCLSVAIERLVVAQKAEARLHKHFKIVPEGDA